MKLAIFGFSVSSSWGNGHAVLWRALIQALAALGTVSVFFERDVPYYAEHRDLTELDGGRLVLYRDWESDRRPGGSSPTPTQQSSPHIARTRSPRPI